MENKDADLLIQYRNGNVAALEQLVEQYRRPLFKFILNMIGGREEADEIFQEVWFRVIKNIDKYKDDKFLSWLFRIARNFIIDRFRSRKKVVSLDKENEAGISLMDRIPGADRSPDVQVGNRDVGRKISEAVAGLPIEQKEVFLMRMEGDLPFKEIAKIQHVSVNTALARMQYALAKLRNELKDEYQAWSERE
ncbi:sigma-70 family RNA polymerase sigma factor [Verrucomicrobiota bacterium]